MKDKSGVEQIFIFLVLLFALLGYCCFLDEVKAWLYK